MDKCKDECGVFGIFGHPEAANMTYLGLYALQHRGQESAGIAATDGEQVRVSRAMGYVADTFDSQALAELPGQLAIGHVRYSTAGESKLSNAQPILIDCAHGQIAICHNGNLVNATELRDDLVRQGSIFQSGSDTEVVLHLYARSKAVSVEDAVVDSVSQVRGAFSLVMLTDDRLIAVRGAVGRAAQDGSHPESLCRPDVHPAAGGHSPFWCQGQAEPGEEHPRGDSRDSGRRLDRAGYDEPEDRENGEGGGSAGSAPAHQLSSDDLALFLWCRHAVPIGVDRRDAHARRDYD